MPRSAKALSPKEVDALTCNTHPETGEVVATSHAVGGVPGLYLHIKPEGGRSWVYRASFRGRRIKRGLGSFSSIGLIAARKAASRIAEGMLENIDPMEQKRAHR